MNINERSANGLCWDEGKMEQKKYTRLLNEFMLQQKPYVSIADSLDTLYQRFLYTTHLSRSAVAPFDFTLIRTLPNGSESFRWILGYDDQKANNILANKSLFTQYADLIFTNLKVDSETLYYKKVLANPSHFGDVEFLTAVFHLTYRFMIPSDLFAVGLIHREHKNKQSHFYKAELCMEKRDVAKVPFFKIGNTPPQPQVGSGLYTEKDAIFQPFIRDWMCIIQGLALDIKACKYEYKYHLYFPVYDSVLPAQRALRGYLGIFCANEACREKAMEYFGDGENRYFKEINDAYRKGVHNHIVDTFTDWEDENAIIDWWVNSIDSLHQWGAIALISESDCKLDDLFWIEGRECKISVRGLLARTPITGYVETSLLEQYSNKVLSLPVPFEVLSDEYLSIQSPFLKERVQDIIRLLDALIRKRHLLVNEEKIKNSARKSAVAAVMARNMSHNIGSHVLSRLSTNQDFPFRVGWHSSKKITALNSYLRTRMDFIAAISTSTRPFITTSLRLYRDVMAYFKPPYKEQAEIMWQELLLDHISGIDDLKSDDIEITLLRNGTQLDLESTGRDLDPSFACPNGLLGTHALYIIVENIIRNSAKHAFQKGVHRRLEITFEINDLKDAELIEICIYDNLQNANIRNWGKTPGVITDSINEKINQSILNVEGNLRNEAWGLLEMQVCAAYLRKIGSEHLDDAFELPLLKAVNISGNLGYKFYLYKPAQVLLVDAKSLCSIKAGIHALLAVNSHEFEKQIKSNIPQRFLVLVEPDDFVLNLVRKHKKSLPMRIFTTNKAYHEFAHLDLNKLHQILNETDACELSVTRRLWKHWTQHIAKDVALFIRYGDANTVAKWQRLGFSESSVSPQDIETLNSNKSYVVLDRHGEIQKNFQKELEQKMSSGSVLYYQQLQQQQPTHNIITYLTEDPQVGERFVYNLIEMGITKVIILDERIQKLSEDIKDANILLKSRLEKMNIIIPPKNKVDLDNPISCYRALKLWVNQNLGKASFLIIHFGILEKLYRDRVDKMQRRLTKIEIAFPQVNIVIISGRGLPEQVAKLEARFLNYSQVARYVLEEISKYHLNKVLFAARRYQSWTNH